MKSITLLTALAAAIPAVTYAEPLQTYERDRDSTYYRNDVDRDRPEGFHHEHYYRFGTSHWANDVTGRWIRLVRANSASGRREFAVNMQNRYRTFRLEALWGEPVIDRIAITFGNGSTQVIDVNGAIPAGSGEIIDLRGNERRVGRIVVYADPRSRGGYAIYGT
jgi:hypothetical protein